ncbi:TPM domain-containing protein [Xanthobacter sp. V4C-4]|uniref:TPM domain-containing protein n=1 Tax=Xanthobacter cornucopiae TaxID=3119924 RepID=UPI00372B8A3C
MAGGLLLAACAGALALSFPPLTGRVVDAAGVLDAATRAQLEARLAAQEGKTSDQVVVATVPGLEGLPIEDYGNALFRAWRLGQDGKNNGVLLLVAPMERKVRIEVGYGLEGILTDAVASTIIRNAIVPAFKAGNMAGGILSGTDALLEVLNLDPEEARARARAAEPEAATEDWLGLILLLLMIALWIYIFWRAARGSGPGGPTAGRRRRAATAAGPVTTWDWSRDRGGSSGGSGGWSGGGGSSGGGGASGSW